MRRISVCAAALAAAAVTAGAGATFHLMQIEQVIGGVGGDTGAQAIQLRMRAFGQNLVSSGRLRVHDAQGLNPVMLIDFATNVPNGAPGARVLVTTADFQDFSDPDISPDFTLTNPIPESYLAAGSMTFENNLGTIIYWRLSWGGDAYTGPTTGAITNDADGEFGPPYPDPLPSEGEQALLFQGAVNAPSTSNEADYALTAGAAIFTNNANQSTTVSAPKTPCPWDCADPPDGLVGILDFLALLAEWGQAGTGCDIVGGGDGVGILDFLELLANWGSCP